MRPTVRSFLSRSFAASVLAGALVSAVACGGDDDEESAFATSASFCTARAAAECKVAGVCSVSADGCKTKRESACNDAIAAGTAKGLVYRSGFAEACLTALDAAYGKSGVTEADVAAAVARCEDVLSGSKKENDACAADANECEGNLVCDKGFCAQAVEKKLGQPCGNPGETCELAGHCKQRAGGGPFVCEAKKKQGELCSSTDPCVEELRCQGTCVARFKAGESCLADPKGCAKDAAYCDPRSSLCSTLVFYPGATLCKDYGG